MAEWTAENGLYLFVFAMGWLCGIATLPFLDAFSKAYIAAREEKVSIHKERKEMMIEHERHDRNIQ